MFDVDRRRRRWCSTCCGLAAARPFVVVDHAKLFDAVVDPTSALEAP